MKPVLQAGLIGAHISRTRLPAALSILCEAHGLALDFSLIDSAGISGFDFAETVARLRAAGWVGISVTHPFKTEAARLFGPAMDAEIRPLGAVNLVTFATRLHAPPRAFNTDFTGFRAAWRQRMGAASVGHVAIAGAGGVARAIGFALADLGARSITLWDRDPGRARDLAEALAAGGTPARAIGLNEAAMAIARADGLVNATPLGMAHSPGNAFPAAFPQAQHWAFDAVYTPTDTEFLRAAAQAGARILSGFDLFRHMAIDTFEAYSGMQVDGAAFLSHLDILRPED